MTYEYQDLVTGEVFEVQQRITEPALTERDGHPVRRLISAESGGFRLVSGESGGWASTGYAKPEAARKAEATLGRKLIPRAT